MLVSIRHLLTTSSAQAALPQPSCLPAHAPPSHTRSLTRIPRLRRLRPAIDASLDRVAARRSTASPARTKARKARSDGSRNRPTRPQPIWDQNPISKTRSGSRAGGEQCALVLVKVRHGLMTANLRSPTSTDDEGKIRRQRDGPRYQGFCAGHRRFVRHRRHLRPARSS